MGVLIAGALFLVSAGIVVFRWLRWMMVPPGIAAILSLAVASFATYGVGVLLNALVMAIAASPMLMLAILAGCVVVAGVAIYRARLRAQAVGGTVIGESDWEIR